MGTSLTPIGVRFQAQGVEQMQSVVRGLGTEMSGFGRTATKTLSATSFAVSQFASQGEISLKGLANSAGGFLSFFGAGGLIASGAIAAGLALVDFFQRTQKEITATAQKAIDEAKRAQREITLAMRTGDAAGLVERAKALETGSADRQGLADLRNERRQLESDIAGQKLLITTFGAERTAAENVAAQRTLEALERRHGVLLGQIAALEREMAALMSAALNVPDARPPRGTIRVTAQGAGSRDPGQLLERAKASQMVVGKGALPDFMGRAEVKTRIDLSTSEFYALFAHEMSDEARQMEGELQSIGESIASSVLGGFAAGLGRGGIGNAFQDATTQLLQGLGNLFMEVGAKAIAGSALMATIVEGLKSLNPWAAVAAGVALIAVASAMGARSGGGGSRAFGGGTQPNASSRILITDPNAALSRRSLTPGIAPVGAAGQGQVIRVIGSSTPEGQRLIGESNARFVSRGGR